MKVIALQLVFTLALFACVFVERKGIYKGFETGKAIKSLAFTFTVQLTKNVARLGAAEVPADRGTFFFFVSLSLSHSEVLLAQCFLYYFTCRIHGLIHPLQQINCLLSQLPKAIKSIVQIKSRSKHTELLLNMTDTWKSVELTAF